MFQSVRIINVASNAGQRASAAYRAVQSQPAWITRIALLTMFIIIALPVVLLVVFAMLLATIVFSVLAIANMILSRLRGFLPRRDGRANVRVMQRINN